MTCNLRHPMCLRHPVCTQCTWDTSRRRPIGCLKLQVISHKRANNYRALLRKMTYKDKASHDSTPPCTHPCTSRTLYLYIHLHINHAVGKTKTHRTGHFPQKSPTIIGSLAGNDLQLIRHSMGLRLPVSHVHYTHTSIYISTTQLGKLCWGVPPPWLAGKISFKRQLFYSFWYGQHGFELTFENFVIV